MANRVVDLGGGRPRAKRTECFGMTADPACYVPRRATERALDALVASIGRAANPVALVGPSGIGKTMLLRVLATRMSPELEAIYLPFPKLAQSEVCALTLGLIGHPISEYPEEQILALAFERRAAGGACVLLVDDASSMPLEAARGLAGLAAVSHGGLRLVLAADDDGRVGRLVEAVGPGVDLVRLVDPMDLGETGHYLRRRVEVKLGAQEAQRIEPETVADIHRESGGIPQLIHLLTDTLLKPRDAPSGPVGTLGAPTPLPDRPRASPRPDPPA